MFKEYYHGIKKKEIIKFCARWYSGFQEELISLFPCSCWGAETVGCGLFVILEYAMFTTFMWMFVEGEISNDIFYFHYRIIFVKYVIVGL